MNKRILTSVILTLSISGCATVDSFDDENVFSDEMATDTVAQPQPTEPVPMVEKAKNESDAKVVPPKSMSLAPSKQSLLMPSTIKPETGATYIRKLDTKTGKVSIAGSGLALMEALKPLAAHGNIEVMDRIVDLSLLGDLSVNGMSLERYLLVVERAYDVEITDHGSRLSVAGVLDGVINAPNAEEGFSDAAFNYLHSYDTQKPVFVTPLAKGKYAITGSPNAVKTLLTADNGDDYAGQQVMVDILIKDPSGQLSQTKFLAKTEGTSSAPIGNGTVSVSVSMDGDHQISSDIVVTIDGEPSQSYQVIQQSGNSLPLTFGQTNAQYEIAYMAKLVSQLYGR